MEATTNPQPIRERISELLAKLNRKSGWLATRARVERSTVMRILAGERIPNPDTLCRLARGLGLTVEELVEGTDVAYRLDGARKPVEHEEYEDAVRQFVAMEVRVLELSGRVREAEKALDVEINRRRRMEKMLEKAQTTIDDAQSKARQYQVDAEIFKNKLTEALMELALLKGTAKQ